jgi:hypothetical protein
MGDKDDDKKQTKIVVVYTLAGDLGEGCRKRRFMMLLHSVLATKFALLFSLVLLFISN